MIREMRFGARVFFLLAITCGVMLFLSVMFEAPPRECISWILGLLLTFGMYRHLLEQVMSNESTPSGRNAFVGDDDDRYPQSAAPRPSGGGMTYDPSDDD